MMQSDSLSINYSVEGEVNRDNDKLQTRKGYKKSRIG